MLQRRVLLCATCLAICGLEPGVSFALQSILNNQRDSRSCSKFKSKGDGRLIDHRGSAAHVFASSSHGPSITRTDGAHWHSPPREHGEPTEASGIEQARNATGGKKNAEPLFGPLHDQDRWIRPSPTNGLPAILAAVIVLLSTQVLATPLVHASDAAVSSGSPTHFQFLVAPKRLPSGKSRLPPPEIPPGRITIVQWCQRNIAPYIPTVDLHAASESLARIRSSSGPAPSADDMRRMVGALVSRGMGASSGNNPAARGGGRGGAVPRTPTTSSRLTVVDDETPPGVLPTDVVSNPDVKTSREQIDLLKAELLEQQATGLKASSEGSAASAAISKPGPRTPVRSPFKRLAVEAPSPFRGASSSPTEHTATPSTDRPARRRQKRQERLRPGPAVVDLREELRAEAEKAATVANPTSKVRNNVDAKGSSVRLADVELVAPAHLYSPPDEPSSSLSPSGAARAGTSSSERGQSVKRLSSSTEPDAARAAAAAPSEALGVERVSEQAKMASGAQSFPGQFQSQARGASSGAQDTIVSITEGLSTAMDTLSVSTQEAKAGVAEVSERLAVRFSRSAKDAAGVTAGLQSTVASVVLDSLRRGAATALPTLNEVPTMLKADASALSKNTAEGLASFRERALQGSSRFPDQAGRVVSMAKDAATMRASQVGGVVSAGAAQTREVLSSRLPQVVERISLGLETLTGRISNTVTESLSSIGSRSQDATRQALEDVPNGVARLAARGTSALSDLCENVAENVTNASSTRGRSLTVGLASVLAITGATMSAVQARVSVGSQGRREETIGSEDVERILQPIGASEEAVASGDGTRYGVEAMAATSTLWDIIRESGTGAGDAVREVSEADLLARAASVGGQLRETAQGLDILKEEVFSLRQSIRDTDLEGKAKALREKLAVALEGTDAE